MTLSFLSFLTEWPISKDSTKMSKSPTVCKAVNAWGNSQGFQFQGIFSSARSKYTYQWPFLGDCDFSLSLTLKGKFLYLLFQTKIQQYFIILIILIILIIISAFDFCWILISFLAATRKPWLAPSLSVYLIQW